MPRLPAKRGGEEVVALLAVAAAALQLALTRVEDEHQLRQQVLVQLALLLQLDHRPDSPQWQLHLALRNDCFNSYPLSSRRTVHVAPWSDTLRQNTSVTSSKLLFAHFLSTCCCCLLDGTVLLEPVV